MNNVYKVRVGNNVPRVVTWMGSGHFCHRGNNIQGRVVNILKIIRRPTAM